MSQCPRCLHKTQRFMVKQSPYRTAVGVSLTVPWMCFALSCMRVFSQFCHPCLHAQAPERALRLEAVGFQLRVLDMMPRGRHNRFSDHMGVPQNEGHLVWIQNHRIPHIRTPEWGPDFGNSYTAGPNNGFSSQNEPRNSEDPDKNRHLCTHTGVSKSQGSNRDPKQ